MRYVYIACGIVTLAIGAWATDIVIGKYSELSYVAAKTSGNLIVEKASTGPSYWTDPNAANKVACYDFETTNTTQTLDTSGNAHNASNAPTVATGPTWTIVGTNIYGRVEHGYTFDGSDDYFHALDHADWTLGTNATLCMWVKSSDTTADVLAHMNTGSPYAGFAFSLGYAGHTGYYMLWDGTGWRIDYLGTPATWTHVAFVLEATTVSMYLDGILTDTDTLASVGDATTSLYIGRDGNEPGVRYFAGVLDEVWIYNKALSSNEVFSMQQYINPTNNLVLR